MINVRELYRGFWVAQIIPMDASVNGNDDSGRWDAGACRNRRGLLTGVMDDDCKLRVSVKSMVRCSSGSIEW